MSRPIGTPAELERRRRHAVELMERGESPTTIARILGVARPSLYRWRQTARSRPDGLAAKPHPGPAPRLRDAPGPARRPAGAPQGLPPRRGPRPRLPPRAVDGQARRGGHPPPLRPLLPPRARPQDPQAPPPLKLAEAPGLGHAARRRGDRALA